MYSDFAAKVPGRPMNIKMEFTLKDGTKKIVGRLFIFLVPRPFNYPTFNNRYGAHNRSIQG